MSCLKIDSGKKILVSKWLKHQVLLDVAEMEKLLDHLNPLYLFNVSEIKSFEELEISKGEFLNSYGEYIQLLKDGIVPVKPCRHFSSALTVDHGLLYATEVVPGRFMAKGMKPIIQMQQHRFFASKTGETIQPMVLSGESIHWGLQFAYPQIFFDSEQNVYEKITTSDRFPNTALFSKLIKWLRTETVPTTFLLSGKKICTPLRLGRECLKWIHHHPQLLKQQVSVHVY